MKLNELPQWDKCREAIKIGESTALYKFIHEQEPAGIKESDIFRAQLLELINEIKGNQNE